MPRAYLSEPAGHHKRTYVSSKTEQVVSSCDVSVLYSGASQIESGTAKRIRFFFAVAAGKFRVNVHRRPRPLPPPCISLPIDRSLTIPPFGAAHSRILRAF
jgi:hypothetical protein